MTNDTTTLAAVVANGNRGRDLFGPSLIVCADGFTMSVIAGAGAAARKGDGDGYATLEVGYPSERPEPWDYWGAKAEGRFDPTGTIYPFVPVERVAALIAAHGGEANGG